MLDFRPIFDSYLLVGLITLGLAAVLAIQPDPQTGLSPRRRRILFALRSASFLGVVAVMLRPTWVRTESRVEAATLVVLADRSRSMSVTDESNGSRWQALEKAVSAIRDATQPYPELLKLALFTFADRAEPLTAKGPDSGLPQVANGEQTDIGGSLSDVLKQEASSKLAGVILLSDGTQRATSPRSDLQQPARELARRGVPLLSVAFGKAREQSQSRDVSLQNFPDQFSVFVENELTMSGTVRIQGYTDRAIPIELQITHPDGSKELLGPKTARVTADAQMVDVHFNFIPKATGEYRLLLRSPPQPDEQVADNNELSAFLDVLDGGLRILYLDGNPAWQEQKFLRRSVDASPDMDLDYTWVDVRTRSKWPIDLIGMFAAQRYDVLILGDVHFEAIGDDQAKWLADRIDEGLGLLMLGGAHSFGSGGYATAAPLTQVIPLAMSALERRDPDSPLDPRQQIEEDLQAVPQGSHFITTLQGGDTTWRELPPFHGANLVKPSEVGRVLLVGVPEAGGLEVPLLVASEYGLGRVLALAVDSTFRWYRQGFRPQHQQFWRQMLLWLARKDAADAGKVSLQLNQRRIPSGGTLSFDAAARDKTGAVIEDAEMSVKLKRVVAEEAPDRPPSGGANQATTKDVAMDWKTTSEKGHVQGISAAIRATGLYQVEVRAKRGGEDLGTATASFVVTQQDLELADPVASPQQLAMLSAFTSAAGGKLLAPEQLPEACRELAARRQENRMEYEQRWQLGDTTWDAALFMLLVVGLLSVEWYLRKRWSLV